MKEDGGDKWRSGEEIGSLNGWKMYTQMGEIDTRNTSRTICSDLLAELVQVVNGSARGLAIVEFLVKSSDEKLWENILVRNSGLV